MKYSLGTNLADFGFGFFEKLHEPIFLFNKKLGRIVKVNEAGRKLIRVAKINLISLEQFTHKQIAKAFNAQKREFKRIRIASSNLNLLMRDLADSDFVLVEVTR